MLLPWPVLLSWPLLLLGLMRCRSWLTLCCGEGSGGGEGSRSAGRRRGRGGRADADACGGCRGQGRVFVASPWMWGDGFLVRARVGMLARKKRKTTKWSYLLLCLGAHTGTLAMARERPGTGARCSHMRAQPKAFGRAWPDPAERIFYFPRDWRGRQQSKWRLAGSRASRLRREKYGRLVPSKPNENARSTKQRASLQCTRDVRCRRVHFLPLLRNAAAAEPPRWDPPPPCGRYSAVTSAAAAPQSAAARGAAPPRPAPK